MRRIGFTLLFITISLLSGYSQIDKIMKEFGFSSKTNIEESIDSARIRDSLKILELVGEIELIKQNEILTQEKLLAYEHWKEADSLANLHRKEQIDSLRNIARGMPVVIAEDTLFSIYPVHGGSSYITRANNIANMINTLGDDRRVKPDSINLLVLDGYIEIMYNERAIIILSDDDARWMNISLDSMAKVYKEKIVDKV